MQTVTIISDWGNNSHYLPILKGRLGAFVSEQGTPLVNLVELSSTVPPFDIYTMCFIVKSSYSSFPKGTLHLLGVSSEPYKEYKMALANHKGHYFMGIDDGRFSLIFDNSDFVIKDMPLPDKYSTFTFPFYAAEAVKIVADNLFEQLPDANINRFIKEMPAITDNSITEKLYS